MSAVLTRNLQVLTTTRLKAIDVGLLYRDKVKKPNGAFTITDQPIVETKGFLTTLTDDEIRRLNEGGITIARGTKLSLNEELERIPDEIWYKKIDEYTYLSKATVVFYNVSEGITVLTLDKETMKRNAN